jgi:hypothetical protein
MARLQRLARLEKCKTMRSARVSDVATRDPGERAARRSETAQHAQSRDRAAGQAAAGGEDPTRVDRLALRRPAGRGAELPAPGIETISSALAPIAAIARTGTMRRALAPFPVGLLRLSVDALGGCLYAKA